MSRKCHPLPFLILILLAPQTRAEDKDKNTDSFWKQKVSVQAVTFTPDGKSLITAGGGLATGHVAFWNLETMKRTAKFDGVGMVNALAVSPDGKSLIFRETKHIGGYLTKSEVHVWEVATGKRQFQLKSDGSTSAMAIDPSGKLLALGHQGGAITLHELATGKLTATLAEGKADVWAVAFSSDGRMLAVGDKDGVVRLVDVAKRKQTHSMSVENRSVGALAFTPDGKGLVVGAGRDHDDPGELVWFDVADGKEKDRWQGHRGPVVSVLFSRDGKLLASGARSSDIIIWDAVARKKLLELDGPLNLTEVAFSSDGKTLAVAGGTGDFIISSGGVRLWDLPSGRERLHPKAATERDRREAAIAGTADLQAAARARRDRNLPALTQERLRRAEYALKFQQAIAFADRWEFVQACAILDQLRPANGQSDLRGLEWHLLDAALPRSVVLRNSVHHAAVSPDGSMLALAAKQQVELADAATGKTIRTLEGFKRQPEYMTFSPDGKLLAVSDHDIGPSSVRVYNVSDGKLAAELTGDFYGVECLTFSGDGNLLASGGRNKHIMVWEVKSWKVVYSFDKEDWIVGAIAFSPDAKTLASGTTFHSLHVRDLASGKELFKPGKEHQSVGQDHLLFHPDGKRLLASSDRGMTVLDAVSGRKIGDIKGVQRQRAGTLALGPDRETLIAGWSLVDLRTLRVIANFEQGDYSGRLPRKEDTLLAVSINPSGRVVMVIASDEKTKTVSFPLRQVQHKLSIGGEHLRKVGFAADGSSLLASTYRYIDHQEGNTRVIVGSIDFVEKWNATTGAEQFRVTDADRERLALSFDAGKGVVTSGRAKVSLSEVAGVQAWVTLPGSKKRQIYGAAPDGSTFAAYEDRAGTITLHDASTGAERGRLEGKFSFDGRLRYTADGRGILTWDGDLVLWDAKTGKERNRWKLPGACMAVGLTADGSAPSAVVLWGRERKWVLWSVQLGEPIAELRGCNAFNAAAFSADGQTLATIVDDGTVFLWDAVTGYPRGTLKGHPTGFMSHLAFRPDGRALAAGEYHGEISLWAVPPK